MYDGYSGRYEGGEPVLPEEYEEHVKLLALDLLWSREATITAPTFVSPITLLLLKIRILEELTGQKITIEQQPLPEYWTSNFILRLYGEELTK